MTYTHTLTPTTTTRARTNSTFSKKPPQMSGVMCFSPPLEPVFLGECIHRADERRQVGGAGAIHMRNECERDTLPKGNPANERELKEGVDASPLARPNTIHRTNLYEEKSVALFLLVSHTQVLLCRLPTQGLRAALPLLGSVCYQFDTIQCSHCERTRFDLGPVSVANDTKLSTKTSREKFCDERREQSSADAYRR